MVICTSNEFKHSDSGGRNKYENTAKALGSSDGYSSVLEEEIERDRENYIKASLGGKTCNFF
jgi:hypothetical protein